MAARLKERYLTKVVPDLTKEFKYKNRMAVPRLEIAVAAQERGRLGLDSLGEQVPRPVLKL